MNYAEVVQAITSLDSGICIPSNAEDDGKCPVCGGSGWELVDEERTVGKHVEIIKEARRCTGCNGGHDRKVVEALIAADIPESRSLYDFDWTLYGEDLKREKRIVESFVDRFPDFEREGLGLFITSKTRGSGKTLLASAVGGELIRRFETSTRFVSASNLIEISRQKRDDGDPLEDLISCRVLILDDVGQQRMGRDWLTDLLFRIIDARYQARRTVIVTSNVPLVELDFDDRVVDRLNAMTVTVRLPEYCVRAREANTRKREILTRLGIE